MPLLQCSNLSFAYSTRPTLRDISLTLSPGEFVTLLGPNASGKSTLIQCLLGHLHAQGAIKWDDKPLSAWNRRALARRVAYLPQSPTYDPGQTVLDVLRLGRSPYWSAFGLESARDQQIIHAVGARLDLMSMLDRPMDELSGGQRQRIFIGRCLTQEPAALLLDEPNTHLDLKYQVELCRLLKRLCKEQSIAVLMASHDLNLATAFADRVLLLSEGSVVADGPPSALTADRLSKVYGLALAHIPSSQSAPIFVPQLS